jgi:isoquinoline 1-oxidoreductase alpha subunit
LFFGSAKAVCPLIRVKDRFAKLKYIKRPIFVIYILICLDNINNISKMAIYNLLLNGKKVKLDVEPDMPLLWAIRDFAGLKGTKFGCGMALCGACTVHLNGEPTRSCQLPVSGVGKNDKITTIEGIGDGKLSVIQKAWIEEQVPQCGYCQSGQIMSATALLKSNPNPSDADIDAAMSGNLCRCGTYDRIRKAIHRAADELKVSETGIGKR